MCVSIGERGRERRGRRHSPSTTICSTQCDVTWDCSIKKAIDETITALGKYTLSHGLLSLRACSFSSAGL